MKLFCDCYLNWYLLFSIPNLKEATYSFQVFLHDNKGNTSVPTYVTSKAYGTNYEESLLNRSLQTITKATNGNAILTWGGIIPPLACLICSYTFLFSSLLTIAYLRECIFYFILFQFIFISYICK